MSSELGLRLCFQMPSAEKTYLAAPAVNQHVTLAISTLHSIVWLAGSVVLGRRGVYQAVDRYPGADVKVTVQMVLGLCLTLLWAAVAVRSCRAGRSRWAAEQDVVPAHYVTITLLLMVMLLHPQRLQIQKMGNRHGFVFSLTSLWTMFDQTSLKASLNLAVVRSTAMLIAQMDDMRRIWGKLWVPQATQDLQIFIVGGLVMPLLYNLFKEARSRQRFAEQQALTRQDMGPFWACACYPFAPPRRWTTHPRSS